MFDSITPYGEIFNTEDQNIKKRKTINKNNCFIEIEDFGEGGYKINRFNSTDPKLYLDIKNRPGQNFIE